VTSRITLPGPAALSVWCAVAFLFCSIRAHAFNLPDSDQRTCYGVATCAGSGQDGAYIRNPLSYTDNGDGTVTDNNTGLIWQQTDNGNSYNWNSAVTACGSLAAGFRLPTKKELLTIVNYEITYPGPAIDSKFKNTRSTFYWSSTTSAANSAHAWGVNFSFGSVYVYYKDSALPIRCVKDPVTP